MMVNLRGLKPALIVKRKETSATKARGEQMADKMSELVYAIDRDYLLKNRLLKEGFTRISEEQKYFAFNLFGKFCKVLSRRDCENDPAYKHLIPYVIVTSELNNIFVVRRTEKQSERRLHNKHSIGIGGHVGPTRSTLSIKEEIHIGMLRELKEELTGMDNVGDRFDFTPKFIGFVNDDSNDVGSVHFGLVYELLVNPDRMHSIRVRETENMVGEWMNFHDALALENYETWSELILKGLKNEN